MLLIGDIHITSKRAEPILKELQDFVDKFPDEKNIVFVGDYVYHFSYDRKALLKLFSFFISLYQEGKQVIVLAGNHDWIANHFVFEEGRQAFDLLQKGMKEGPEQGRIEFITTPTHKHIGGYDILFFPFMQFDELTQVDSEYESLLESGHQGELLSARANSELQKLYQTWKSGEKSSDKLLILHHRYIAGTQFPGQQARFSYKSPALDAMWLEKDDVRLLSGHLHQPFSHKNYLCTGSSWSTSPLEVNQMKYFYRLGKEWSVDAYEVSINPYIRFALDTEQTVTEELLREKLQVIRQEQQTTFSSSDWKTSFHTQSIDLLTSACSLTLDSESVSYDQLQNFVTEDVITLMKDIKIKQPYKALPELAEQLNTASMELDKSVADWKTLLTRYLSSKYGEEAGTYEKILSDLEII